MENKLYKVVFPFFIYAAISFFLAMGLLVLHSEVFLGFYIQPNIIAITHIVVLAWATMIILGCCYQLIPFMNHVDMYSYKIAYYSFVLLAFGIPMLIYAFFTLNFDYSAIVGGVCIVSSVGLVLVNLYQTLRVSNIMNINSIYILISIFWLFITVCIGLLMIVNFNYSFLSVHSLHYLSLHVHVGIAGWFLILIVGVSSRLFPMFLVSTYLNDSLLKIILVTIHIGLFNYLLWHMDIIPTYFYWLSIAAFGSSICMYIYFCVQVYRNRFHKNNNTLLDLSGVSLIFLGVSVFITCLVTYFLDSYINLQLIKLFGIAIFLGWIAALILQMTFKILPYIVWTMKYSKHRNAIPYSPVLLYDKRVLIVMGYVYVTGIFSLIPGIIINESILLKCGSFLLLVTALLYNYNVFKILFYKPKISIHETD